MKNWKLCGSVCGLFKDIWAFASRKTTRNAGQDSLYTSRGSNRLPAECLSETEPTSSVVFGKVHHQNFTFFSNLLNSSHMQACEAFQYLTFLTKGVESEGDEK
jgi:hypothetical protein